MWQHKQSTKSIRNAKLIKCNHSNCKWKGSWTIVVKFFIFRYVVRLKRIYNVQHMNSHHISNRHHMINQATTIGQRMINQITIQCIVPHTINPAADIIGHMINLHTDHRRHHYRMINHRMDHLHLANPAAAIIGHPMTIIGHRHHRMIKHHIDHLRVNQAVVIIGHRHHLMISHHIDLLLPVKTGLIFFTKYSYSLQAQCAYCHTFNLRLIGITFLFLLLIWSNRLFSPLVAQTIFIILWSNHISAIIVFIATTWLPPKIYWIRSPSSRPLWQPSKGTNCWR